MCIKDFIKENYLEKGDKVLILDYFNKSLVGRYALVLNIEKEYILLGLEEVFYNEDNTKTISIFNEKVTISKDNLIYLYIKNLGKKTLFEIIKGMTEEELAEFLYKNNKCDICLFEGKCKGKHDCIENILKGLQKIEFGK